MKVKCFEDLLVWQKAQDLTVDIYRKFSLNKDFGFKDQLYRASVSISNNIAEGFDRNSKAEFKRFLSISLGSCSEVKSMVYLALRLDYIAIDEKEKFIDQCIEISKLLNGLIKYLKSNN